jgi:hypothetical protein
MTPHLPIDATHERIAELQAVAAAAHARPSDVRPATDSLGPVGRIRDAIGLRLIELGAAVVSEEHRPRQMTRG